MVKRLLTSFCFLIFAILASNHVVSAHEHTYVVKSGDTLWALSKTYQTTVDELKRVNGLDSDLILIGQKLTIPRSHKTHSLRAASIPQKREQIKEVEHTQPYSMEEHEWLAKIIEAEAGNQDYLGKVAVASVVLNRKNHDAFPDTLKEVIFQKGQFTPVSNGRIHKVKPSRDSIRAAREALEGTEDPTDGALFFYNPKLSKDRWIRTREVTKDIGQHRFAL